MGKYTHKDFKDFKRAFKMRSPEIAELLGIEKTSVNNQTAPSKPLPKWAIAMIHVWKVCEVEVPKVRQRKC